MLCVNHRVYLDYVANSKQHFQVRNCDHIDALNVTPISRFVTGQFLPKMRSSCPRKLTSARRYVRTHQMAKTMICGQRYAYYLKKLKVNIILYQTASLVCPTKMMTWSNLLSKRKVFLQPFRVLIGCSRQGAKRSNLDS